jgi:20S proteasome alpha/beta subunit
MFVFDFDRYPYVTGTSVLGIKYKDGILLASDTAGVALLTACLQPAN